MSNVADLRAHATAVGWHLHTLREAGLQVVPTCLPSEDGGCSAPWHPKPCQSRGKRPLLSAYVQASSGDVDCEIRARGGRVNLALVVGAGQVVVETDSPEAEAEVLGLLDGEPITPTRERRPGRGRAWTFATSADVPCPKHIGASKTIDVLSGPSALLVVAPSVHKSGHRVAWVVGMEPWNVPPAALPPRLADLIVRPGVIGRPVTAPMKAVIEPAISPRVRALLVHRPDVRNLWLGLKSWGDTSRSGVDMSFAVALLRDGVQPAEVVAALALRQDVRRVDATYLNLTVAKASAVAGRRR